MEVRRNTELEAWTWHRITHKLWQANMKSARGSEGSKEGHSWIWHGITHLLSGQQDQSRCENSDKRLAGPGIDTHILSSKQNQSEDSEKRHS